MNDVEFEAFGSFTSDCPARAAFDLFASRWLSVIVWTLRDGPMRPKELEKTIGGIRHKVLTENLRRMEAVGLVERHRYAEAPPRVEYELTPTGRDLLVPIRALGAWAYRNADAIGAMQSEGSA
ncbi:MULTISPECIES: winged helix-turn-helix transcriptional regulator [unclassified Nocardioides]|uniref:winged helix-turn-helix transcriptional regulator n=1 Tax=unclassified Nocardioides TaxID=2615069 RepID=UPI000B7AF1C0|nr:MULTISPECIES: helix-turn-helix domain-containing protein [unclassified Nocardioides]